MKSLLKKTIAGLALSLLATTYITAQETVGQQWTDWANFNRYAEQNKKVPAPSKGERRVVFLGNSIFEGWLSLRPEFFEKKALLQ